MRGLGPSHIFGRPGDDHLPAGVTALRPKIDDVIGHLDDVHVVLDEEHRVPGIDQLIERNEQSLDVCQVQTSRRLVEDVKSVFGALQLAELGGNLDSLRFAAR